MNPKNPQGGYLLRPTYDLHQPVNIKLRLGGFYFLIDPVTNIFSLARFLDEMGNF